MTPRAASLIVALACASGVAGCGAKKPVASAAVQPGMAIPDRWEGVSFDEEFGALGTDLSGLADREWCGPLDELEPEAAEGRLSTDTIACLDHALRLAGKQTTKDALSRLLMADAWAKGDLHRWEGAVRRHLLEIDSSDPDLAYLLAVRLRKQGPATAFEAIRFAELALENRARWGAEVHAERVGTLLRLRALAAADLWYHYEDELLIEKSPENTDQVDRWRSMTKMSAREWLEHAWRAGDDLQAPYDLCVSAAGTLSYCEIGFDAASAEP